MKKLGANVDRKRKEKNKSDVNMGEYHKNNKNGKSEESYGRKK